MENILVVVVLKAIVVKKLGVEFKPICVGIFSPPSPVRT